MPRLILAGFSLILLSSWSLYANGAKPHDREYQIKAAFIANFIRYTHWKNKPRQRFNFCISNHRVNNIFNKALANETWFGLKPQFKLVSPTDTLKCDILFIDSSSSNQWEVLFNVIKTNGLLIVSESRGSSQSYSHINFFLADNKLRFEINPQRVSSSNLSINASLLRLARITSSKETAL
jgi:hypothetical protein